ncbi:hypothetical protein FRC98_01280 [Lujinxingia vulgaris]|uniref:DUF4382 domain-containing protein n=1 Tax=Lujinxingia vulgaris TaxID=2600176 RepID=A0A5C6XAX4_9DELT|nr:hypothetical protein [Lujinxingia vulgaris]TXD39066.1 hypothetical protein FRC98_01280 [Lujinxingia vulgaris]
MNRLRFPALLLLILLSMAGVAACGEADHAEHEDHRDDHDRHDDAHTDTFDIMLFDPTTDDVLADAHGDHWDGDLPELYVGDVLEVGVSIADAEGNPIELGADYTLQVLVAPESPEGIVGLEVHGDHIDIEALAAGESAIVLELHHNGELEWTTPALSLSVGE